MLRPGHGDLGVRHVQVPGRRFDRGDPRRHVSIDVDAKRAIVAGELLI
jgi:hypothetical protein